MEPGRPLDYESPPVRPRPHEAPAGGGLAVIAAALAIVALALSFEASRLREEMLGRSFYLDGPAWQACWLLALPETLCALAISTLAVRGRRWRWLGWAALCASAAALAVLIRTKTR